jgi:hypothetical protein
MIRNPRDLDRRAPVHQHALGLRARELGADQLDHHPPMVKPCASMLASVQPSRQEASSSSAQRRVAGGHALARAVA